MFTKPSPADFAISGLEQNYTLIYEGVESKVAKCVASAIPSYANAEVNWSIVDKTTKTTPNWISIDTDGIISAAKITDNSQIGHHTLVVTATSKTDSSIKKDIETIIDVIRPDIGGVDITFKEPGPYTVVLGTSGPHKIVECSASVFPTGTDQSVIWSIENKTEWIDINSDGLITINNFNDEKLLGKKIFTIKAVSVIDSNKSSSKDITINIVRPEVKDVKIDRSNIDNYYNLNVMQTKIIDCRATAESQWADQSINWSIVAVNNDMDIPDSIKIDQQTGKLTMLNDAPLSILIKIIATSTINTTKTDSAIISINVDYPRPTEIAINGLNASYNVTTGDQNIIIDGIFAVVNPTEAIQNVKWSLKENVPGITIDEQNGTITIDVSIAKTYNFTVVATSDLVGSIYAEKDVTVNVQNIKTEHMIFKITMIVLASTVAVGIIGLIGTTPLIVKKIKAKKIQSKK